MARKFESLKTKTKGGVIKSVMSVNIDAQIKDSLIQLAFANNISLTELVYIMSVDFLKRVEEENKDE